MSGGVQIHIVVDGDHNDEYDAVDVEKLGDYTYSVLKEAGFTNVKRAEAGWEYRAIPYQTPSLLEAMKESNPGLFDREVVVSTWHKKDFDEACRPKEPDIPKTIEQRVNRPGRYWTELKEKANG